MKQIPVHPRDKLKRKDKKNREIYDLNCKWKGEFNCELKKILNKTLLFDTKKIDKEIIMDKIK